MITWIWIHRNFLVQILSITKQLDMTERQVERWLRLRRAQDKPSTLTKFCENTWRCIYYIYSFLFGLIVLWDKVWFWDIKHCWYGYPHQVDYPSCNYLSIRDWINSLFLLLYILVNLKWHLVVLYDIDGFLLVTYCHTIHWCET